MNDSKRGAPRRRVLLLAAAGVATIAAWLLWAALVGVMGYEPPLRGSAPDGATPIGWAWRGAVHAHTVVSGDATGTVGEISAAAKELGLDFVVITDHTRAGRAEEPRRPRWVDGVLIVYGEESSLDEGHLLALGTANHRYTIGPTARQAVEDVRNLEGHPFAAHPDAIATPWRGRLGALDGLEVVNLAAAFDHLLDGSLPALIRAALTYPASAAATLLLALDRTPPTIAQWDSRTALGAEPAPRPLSALGSVDAHGPQVLGMPTYEQALGALTMTVWLPESPETLEGREREAAAMVTAALAKGESALIVDAAGRAPGFIFTATRETGGDGMGPGSLLAATGESWRFEASLGAPGSYRTELLRDGVPIAAIDGDDLSFTSAEPATYRVRVFRTDGPAGAGLDGSLPWILSNPIYLWPEHLIRRTRSFPAPPVPGPPVAVSLLSLPGWAAEADPLSASAMGPLNGGIRWDFTVPRQEEPDVHAALTWRPQDATDWSGYRGISARLATEQEWRVAVHLWTRAPDGSITTWEQVLPARPPESTAGVLWSAFRRLGDNDEGVVPGSLEPGDLADVAGIALLVTPFLMRPGTDTSIDVLEFGLIAGAR